MFVNTIFRRLLFTLVFLLVSLSICYIIFQPLLTSSNIIINVPFGNFNICSKYPDLWEKLKLLYLIFFILSNFIYSNMIYPIFFNKKETKLSDLQKKQMQDLHLDIKNTSVKSPIIIPKEGLYQNILITGTIGTGKTSSAMYPFTRQLIEFKSDNIEEKLGMLILDVKGNYYNQVKTYVDFYHREQDLIVIGLDSNIKYNPLDKPNLKASVLANKLKTILTLFSPNNSESYWLDKAEQVLTECIKLCRLYNNGYVTFVELHKLITIPDYYRDKIKLLKQKFLSGIFSAQDIHNLYSSIEFFEKEFISLDTRTASILKSEITRITGCFVSDYNIQKIFCPEKSELNFHGFSDVVNKGKIVVLNMNISEYRNLSKIIAAYLKLDFQSEVMSRLAHSNEFVRSVAFISDEYHEYVTDTDANFFAQSREAKCINIVATQSYTSLLSSINNQYIVKVIVQNLINKFWFRTDDIFTVEDAQKQIGKEEKDKISLGFSENSNDSSSNSVISSIFSHKTGSSESINRYTQSDYIFDTNFFTRELETFSCVAFISDGSQILPPQKLNLVPYFILDKNMKN